MSEWDLKDRVPEWWDLVLSQTSVVGGDTPSPIADIFNALPFAEQQRILWELSAKATALVLQSDYLKYAPSSAQEYFKTLTPVEQEHVMKRVKYHPDHIDIRDENGEMVSQLEKEDMKIDVETGIPFEDKVLTEKVYTKDERQQEREAYTKAYREYDLSSLSPHPDIREYLKPEAIEHEGVTRYNYEAMMRYIHASGISIPDMDVYNRILDQMPAWDHRETTIWHGWKDKASEQLFNLLGCQLSGRWEDEKRGAFRFSHQEKRGYLMSSSSLTIENKHQPYMLSVVEKDGIIESWFGREHALYMYPVRASRNGSSVS